ncbi:MAG: ABC transporter ATP-binding protein, partial [Pseudolabrys sp.]
PAVRRLSWAPTSTSMAATNDRLSSGASMIDLHHVSKTFRKQDETVDAVRDISLTIAQKEIVAIIGPSGCGKSTLLNMIAGLYAPSSGSIVYKGARVSDVNTDVGYMTQKDNLLPWRTVRDNIAFPLELSGVAKGERAVRADQVIAHVGLDGFAHRYPHELSGGMRKRVCLARMLLYGAETALLDEPFAALDAQLKLAMHDLLLKLAAETGQTVVLVTHDLMEAVTLADRVLVCTRRPATLALEQRIELKRPRDVLNVRFTNEFKEHYDALWERLRVEYHEERL